MGTPLYLMKIGSVVIFSLACLTAAQSSNGKQQHWEYTAEKRHKVQELWALYGPDYSAYQQTEQEFPCVPIPPSHSVPTSVHKLRPSDVKVVGAMGDSLTAGSGITATNVIAVLIQNRGLSWSGGGQTNYEDQITLPNILKKYNPDVYGYATGNGDENSRHSFFNVAVSGSTSSDLVEQAKEMIYRMKTDPKVDFDNDWKVVTILSGNNDLCDYCSEPDTKNYKRFHENVIAALDILHAELPRTLVNLVEPLNVEILRELNKGLICSTLHLFLCDCAAFPGSTQEEEKLTEQTAEYHVVVEQIAASGRYDTREDFTVVAQPFLNQTYLPRIEGGQPDLSYFAPDCFHLSRRGQAAAASALWSNMIEPVGSKRASWKPEEPFECPTEEQPYFFTNKNSEQAAGNIVQQAGSRVDAGASHLSAVGIVVGVCVLVTVAAAVILVVRQQRQRRHYHRICG